jgi:hypothetical protein
MVKEWKKVRFRGIQCAASAAGNGCSFLVNMLPAKSIIWEADEIRVHEKDETSVNYERPSQCEMNDDTENFRR